MEYAVINVQGKQYKVSPGEKLVVDRLANDVGETITIDNVLLHTKDDNTVVGAPNIKGALVKAKVVAHKRGTKIRVLRFRAKSKYHKVTGHRQEQTQLIIESISSSSK